MSTLFVKNVVVDGDETTLFVKDGRIAFIGGGDVLADEILDAKGMIAHPPLINAHTHSSMTLFRGNGDDLPLMEWLTQRVWPYEEQISKEEIYWGAKLAIVEMIRCGTVFFNDMYWDFHEVARAVEETGVRALVSAVLLDTGNSGKLKDQIKLNETLLEESKAYSDHVQFGVAPHAIYTVSEEGLRWAADFTGEHHLVFHTHLSETEHEVQECLKEHGCTPTEYLDKVGAVSERMVAAHTVWLSENDIRILGEKKAVCVHNPVSNMKLAVNNVYPWRKLKEAGAVLALGTDGAGSNNNLDMFEEMKIAALLQKFRDNDPTSLPAVDVLDMAVNGPAKTFGIDDGPIRVGRQADFILLDTTNDAMVPMHSLASHLVYSANGAVVDSVVCDGKVLMKHRKIEGEEEIRAKAGEAAGTMFARVDEAR